MTHADSIRRLELRALSAIERPVDLVRRLRDLCAPLAAAHAAVGALAETGSANVALSANGSRVADVLAEFGIEVISSPATASEEARVIG